MYSTETKLPLFSDKQPPPVHVLMPVYNANKFVLASLGSVLDQNYPNIKILIFNDGSSDNTLELIHQLIQEKPDLKNKIMIKGSELNRGVAHARMQLFKWSREIEPNSYIFWLDSDDKYTRNDFIHIVINRMLITRADICLFNFSIKYEDLTQQANAVGLLRDKERIAQFLNAIVSHPSQSISPSELPDILKFTSLGWTKCYAPTVQLSAPLDCPYEDFVFMAVLLEANKITALPPEIEPVEYLRRSTSICGQRKESNFTHDIPLQLKRFFDVVLSRSENANDKVQRLDKAKKFVIDKFEQYQLTLKKLIETKYSGITLHTEEIFNIKAKEILDYIDEKLQPMLSPQHKV